MRANDNRLVPDETAMETAADWVDRLEDLGAAERVELRAWLAASHAHAAAFDRLLHVLRDPALIQAAAELRRSPRQAPPRVVPVGIAARRRASPLAWGLLAASLVASAVFVGVLALPRFDDRQPPLVLATAVGARSDYGLSDASRVHLNADSRVSVRFSPDARDLMLERGDAVFDVAKNRAWPFNVHAGEIEVTAVGTSFEVDRIDGAVEVRVFEGVVRVSIHDAPARRLAKGEWLLVDVGREASGRFEPETYETWRSGWLVADQMPLKFVVARLNRYGGYQIVVRDPTIENLKVTGRFRLSRPADAVSMMTALTDVKATRDGGRIYLTPRRETGRPAARRPAA